MTISRNLGFIFNIIHFSVWQYAHSTHYYSYAFLINLTRTIARQIRHQFEGNVTVHKCYLHSARMQLSFCLVTVSLYVATTTFPLRKTWEKNPTISHHSLLISMLHLYVSTILFTLRKLFLTPLTTERLNIFTVTSDSTGIFLTKQIIVLAATTLALSHTYSNVLLWWSCVSHT